MRTHYTFLLVLLLFPFINYSQTDSLFAEFAADATSGCAPLNIRYFDLSAETTTSWKWTFEGGSPSTSNIANPEVLYEIPGNHMVALEVSDGTSLAFDTVYVNITEPAPTTDFKFEFNDLTVDFENLTNGATQYSWDFGDDHYSTETSPSHTYAEEGIYIVKLKAANSCSSVTYTEILVLECCHEIPDYTANDFILPYDGSFRPGTNLGYFPPWTDADLANIAAGNEALGLPGVGVKTIRPALPEHFMEAYGYDIRFDTYKHFTTLGLEDLTVTVGFPSEEHRDTAFHCQEEQSEVFANLYTDIWDNGENGTPVNDSNYYALYLYKLVNLYKDNVKFWEIWNEPGFDYTFVTAYLPPGVEGNWWENNPDPCDYKLRAPIFNYVRLLRISYEVIKYVDPDAYVTLASVAYPAFLDAILRNTDNPDNGIANSEYPYGAGAYFDVIAIHSYPHFDGSLSEWNQDIFDFDYFRHTDQAITSLPVTQDTFQHVLSQYGYDGVSFPKKKWIITETNIPRKAFLNYIGSEEAQINFTMKVYVESVRSDILQTHIYDMAESHDIDEAVNEFQVMGLFQRLFGIFPYTYTTNNMGYAYKTMSDILYGGTYDQNKTAELSLSPDMDGAAFLNAQGNYVYVLWAKTTQDLSENASATYSFPPSMNINSLEKRSWDFGTTGIVDTIQSTNIQLTGRPILLTDKELTLLVPPQADFSINKTDECIAGTIQFMNESSANADSLIWFFEGGVPAFSNELNPVVQYNSPGTFNVELHVFNSVGEDSKVESNLINISEGSPVADFTLEIFEENVSFANLSQNATHFSWSLGDENVFTDRNPTHTYPGPGMYEITLIAYNACDSNSTTQTIIILPEQTPPIPEFTSDLQYGCRPSTVQFYDESTENATSWFWVFEGGVPNTSTEQNPVVEYTNPGAFFVTLMASNDAGGFQLYKDDWITIEDTPAPVATFEYEINGSQVSLINNSENSNLFEWNFGDGNFSSIENPIHTYAGGGNYTINLIASNSCGTDLQTTELIIEGPPVATFSTGANNICEGSEVQYFGVSSSNSVTWSWNFPGGVPETSDEQNPIIVYPTVGVYDATLIIFNTVGSDTVTQTGVVEVVSPPQASFQYETNELEVSFQNLSENGNSFQWNFGDGTTSNDNNPVHSYAIEGSYLVELIAYNACDTATSQQEITLLLPPLANFNFDPAEACSPAQIQFNDLSTSNPLSWEWSFPGGNPTESNLQNPIVSYTTGTYSAGLIVVNAAGSDTLFLEEIITIDELPEADFEFSGSEAAFQFSNTSTEATSFEWDFGDGTTSTVENPNHEFSASGTYEVSLMAFNDCGTDTLTQQVQVIITSEHTPANLFKAEIFPNPNDGKFIIQLLGEPEQRVELRIYNLLGQNVLREPLPFHTGEYTKSFDLDQLGSGSYFFHFYLEENHFYKKVIIQK